MLERTARAHDEEAKVGTVGRGAWHASRMPASQLVYLSVVLLQVARNCALMACQEVLKADDKGFLSERRMLRCRSGASVTQAAHLSLALKVAKASEATSKFATSTLKGGGAKALTSVPRRLVVSTALPVVQRAAYLVKELEEDGPLQHLAGGRSYIMLQAVKTRWFRLLPSH
jgi:hypothetical protein